MPYRYRRHDIALGGCLICVLLALSSALRAQQQPEKLTSPPPQSQQVLPDSIAQRPSADSTTRQEGAEPGQLAPRSPPSQVDKGVKVWKIFITWSDSLAQWFMAIGGLVATGVSIWAIFLLRATLKATRDAVTEAEMGSAAAREANEIARDTARRELRAYVTVEVAKLQTFEVGKRISAQLKINNVGTTPMYKAFQISGIGMGPYPYPDEETAWATMTIEDARKNYPIKQFYLGRSGNLEKESGFVMSEEDRNAILSGDRRVYIYGSLFYDDIFEQTHRTTFCWYWAGDQTATMTAQQYEKYNDAD